MIRMLEKDKLIIYRSQDLLSEYDQKLQTNGRRSDVIQYDSRCLKMKPAAVTLPYESTCKKLKFSDNETTMTFLNYYPLTTAER